MRTLIFIILVVLIQMFDVVMIYLSSNNYYGFEFKLSFQQVLIFLILFFLDLALSPEKCKK